MIKYQKIKCQYCDHSWTPRKKQYPDQCAKCRRKHWRKKRKTKEIQDVLNIPRFAEIILILTLSYPNTKTQKQLEKELQISQAEISRRLSILANNNFITKIQRNRKEYECRLNEHVMTIKFVEYLKFVLKKDYDKEISFLQERIKFEKKVTLNLLKDNLKKLYKGEKYREERKELKKQFEEGTIAPLISERESFKKSRELTVIIFDSIQKIKTKHYDFKIILITYLAAYYSYHKHLFASGRSGDITINIIFYSFLNHVKTHPDFKVIERHFVHKRILEYSDSSTSRISKKSLDKATKWIYHLISLHQELKRKDTDNINSQLGFMFWQKNSECILKAKIKNKR